MFQQPQTTKRIAKISFAAGKGWADYKKQHRQKPILSDETRLHDARARITGICCPHGKPVFTTRLANSGRVLQACDCKACSEAGYLTQEKIQLYIELDNL